MSNPITGDVNTTVLLSNYLNGDLSISSTGLVDPTAAVYGTTGVTGDTPDATLTNAGTILGGNSSGGISATVLGLGGIGVNAEWSSDVFDNTGSITGGNGGNAGVSAADDGGRGGIGVNLNGASLSDLGGTISGGSGGNSALAIGGSGGDGVRIVAGSGFSNNGLAVIKGGSGGSGAVSGGVGGVGLYLFLATATTNGAIDGGTGGNGVYDASIGGAAGGDGGVGVNLGSGEFTVAATSVTGGAGGIGGNATAAGEGQSGTGGTGILVESATLINSTLPIPGGFIYGGTGGAGHAGGAGAGAGGIGVSVYGFNALFDNQAVVWGGRGGYANDTTGSIAAANGGVGGVGVDVSQSANLTNAGVIHGGYGGNDNTPGGTAGTGGVGVLIDGPVNNATNSAGDVIKGGAGGHGGGVTSVGGTGGAGIELTGEARFTNVGLNSLTLDESTIVGGTGGTGTAGDGAGGVGAYLDGGTLFTGGVIFGGESGNGLVQADSVFFAAGPPSSLTVEAGAAFKGAIGGFSYDDTVTVTTLAPSAVQSDFNTTTDTLSLPTADGGTLQFSGNFTGETFTFTADGGGTDITLEAACYRRGTHLATLAGDIRIEQLGVGDLVLTAAGEARAVRWLGYRTLDVTQHPEPKTVWPVRVAAGAFGVGLPVRDLYLSPGHNVVVGDSLVPIAALVNGATIRQIPCDTVEYWHVELDQHDIVLAEKLAAESYLDTGNRAAFSNGGEFVERHPSFAPVHWSDTCLPLVFDGAVVDAARSRLMERAHEVGFTITADDDLHIVADGTRIEAVTLSPARRAFVLPEGARVIELRSREFVPAEVLAGSRDVRRLGVCVGSLALDGDAVPLENVQQFEQGWHGLEQTADGVMQRWTTGTAVLPPKTRLVVIDLAGRGHYWQRALPRSVAVA